MAHSLLTPALVETPLVTTVHQQHSRTAYDDIGMPGPSFDQHLGKAHYLWNYLYFVQ